MKKVYIINGPAGTGKDTFINICRLFLSGNLNVVTYSAVDEVKQHLKDNENWDGVTKDSYWRLRMYEVKMQMVADNDRPTRYLIESVENTPDDSIVFLHIREPDEIVKLLRLYPDAQTIHMDREGVERFVNPADALTQTIEYNFYLLNNGGLEELAEQVRAFILENVGEGLISGEQLDFGSFQ
ncbi:MAG: hypothetical protein SGJ04_08880 [Bacteroidota bacterium]|nr:hypothetical protein [Bacteroidota bacterium]